MNKKYSLLGFELFRRELVSSEKIELDVDPIVCEDIGLYILSKNPRLEYNNNFLSEQINWHWELSMTLKLTLLNLIHKGALSLMKHHYSIKYPFLKNKIQKYEYYLENSNQNNDEDIFTMMVYNAIKQVNIDVDRPTMSEYIKKISDSVLHESDRLIDPSRSFMIDMLKRYAKNVPWLNISEDSTLLGVHKKYALEFQEIYIPRLSMQHKSLSDLHSHLYFQHTEYKNFMDVLEIDLKQDLNRRTSKEY